MWDRVRDQNAFILLFGFKMEEMGPHLNAMGAFEGQEFLVTPLIGKLCLHIQNYFDNKDFYVYPLMN